MLRNEFFQGSVNLMTHGPSVTKPCHNYPTSEIKPAENLNIRIMLSNVRSIKHLEDLEALLSSLETPIKKLCLTETWLKETDIIEMYKISRFHKTLTKKRITRGGGTMIQLGYKTTLIDKLETGLPELVSAIAEPLGNKW